MTILGCTREPELQALLERGQWPQASPAELRAHVAGCRACSDLVAVKQAMEEARAAAMAAPQLPTASALWWRAQLRRRNAAVERVGRPILGAEIFALAMMVAVALGGLAWELRRGVHAVTLNPSTWIGTLHLESLWPSWLGSLGFVVPVLAMLAVLSGVAVYFTLEKR
ncbi:MAG TPA: hypothetical protein VL967_03530 [Terracidiphilus sp.]|nr:hypothetical protein [Terracidiphilus sp.]